MGEIEEAITKYRNDHIFNKMTSTLIDGLCSEVIKVDDLRLAVKLAIFEYDRKIMKLRSVINI